MRWTLLELTPAQHFTKPPARVLARLPPLKSRSAVLVVRLPMRRLSRPFRIAAVVSAENRRFYAENG